MTDPRPDDAPQAFQVDLRGVVDLLSRHLYSGPRVYLRELLQNAVDAITARRSTEPGCPARVRLAFPEEGALEVLDTGVGLDVTEAAELLATIGRSSKRDLVLGTGRADLLGQFGIGLLSAFMVADEVELVSRSAHGGRPVRWTGSSDGSYRLVELDEHEAAALAAAGLDVGSRVRLVARPDMAHWLARDTVVALAADVGGLLPVDVAVETRLSGGETLWERVTVDRPPWETTGPGRDVALRRHCERTLGFTPLTHLDLEVPLAGLRGVAYVLPTPASPSSAGSHRVYLKRMLLGTKVDGLLPEWAFFVRCVLDTSGLRPTASREQLYEDDVLLATREELGRQVRRWITEVLEGQTELRDRFVAAHHLAIRAMAVSETDLLETAAQVLPFETTEGTRTLAEVATEHGTVLHTTDVEEYRRVAPVARAQGLCLVNGGYVYDADLLARLAERPGWSVRPLSVADVAQVLRPLDPAEEISWLEVLAAGGAALADQEVEVAVRRFAPADLPAMLLLDRAQEHQHELRRLAATSDLWGASLSHLARPAEPRRLVVNADNPVVARLRDSPPGEVRDAAFGALYVSASMLAGRPLRGSEHGLMTTSLAQLLGHALASHPTQEGRP